MSATIATAAPAPAAKPWYRVLYVQVLIGIVLGACRRLAMARSGDQRLDQGARRRLHQADQDGDRADHLLHGGFRHRAYPGCQEGRPHRRQGAGLFRDRLDLRARHRAARRKSGASGRGLRRLHGQCAGGSQLRQAGRVPEERRFLPAHHSRYGRRRLCERRDPAGPAVFNSVRLCRDEPWRARQKPARVCRRGGARGFRRHFHRHEGRADRRVRSHGLHDRQVRHRRHPESDRPDRDVLSHGRAFRVRGAGHHRADRRLLDLQVPCLHQGRVADRARHLVFGKRAAVPDGKAGTARLFQVGRGPGGADRIFVQSRRHEYLHDARNPVHRAGARFRSDASASRSPSWWSRC